MRYTDIWSAIVLACLLGPALAEAASPQGGVASDVVVGDRWVHQVIAGETWQTVAARVGVDPEVLAISNNLESDTPLRSGDVVGIDNRHVAPRHSGDGIVINVPQRMLFHYSQGTVRAAYPIAAGHPDSPTGLWFVHSRGYGYLFRVGPVAAMPPRTAR